MRCAYCKSDVSMAEESEHTKEHVLALARTGDFTAREIALALNITQGRAASYISNAGLRLRLFRKKHAIAVGADAAEVEAEGRTFARHGFVPASDILKAAGGARYVYQIWEKGAETEGDGSDKGRWRDGR